MRCGNCSSRKSQPYQLGHKMTDITSLPASGRQAFLQNLRGLSTKREVKELASRSLPTITRNDDFFQNPTTFLSLSAYSKMGYDIDTITEHTLAHNKISHPVLGVVYGAACLKQGISGTRGEETSDVDRLTARDLDTTRGLGDRWREISCRII